MEKYYKDKEDLLKKTIVETDGKKDNFKKDNFNIDEAVLDLYR